MTPGPPSSSISPSPIEHLLLQAGLSSCVLESEHLRAVVVPALGGKIVSLVSKRTGTEWLLPPLQPYASASQAHGFERSDGGGFDECLPTVGASGSASDPVPDHGDLWRVPWHGGMVGGALELHARAKTRSLRLTRRAIVAGACLMLDYELENTGNARTDVLYSAHPLLHVQAGDRIVLPSGVTSVMVESSSGERLGQPGDSIAWPFASDAMTKQIRDLSLVGSPADLSPADISADKLFAGPLREGCCGLFRPALGEGVRLRFDPAALPYLGIWICNGAWPLTGVRKQHTVALEPTTSDRDALDDASAASTALWLEPGDKPRWTLVFDLVESEASCRQNTP
ncbi:MAG: hypothetical protein ACR2JE_08710 [Acidobacteriaceae bacterium]